LLLKSYSFQITFLDDYKNKKINTAFGVFYLIAGTASLVVDAHVITDLVRLNKQRRILERVFADGVMDLEERLFLGKQYPGTLTMIESFAGVPKAPLTSKNLTDGKIALSPLAVEEIKDKLRTKRNRKIGSGILAASLSGTVLIASASYLGVGLTSTPRVNAMRNFARLASEIDTLVLNRKSM